LLEPGCPGLGWRAASAAPMATKTAGPIARTQELPLPAVPSPLQGKALSDLKKDLRCGADPEAHLRAKGALLRVLGPAGAAAELIDVLTGARGDRGDAEARYSAVCSLRDLGRPASGQAAALALAMRDEDPHVRHAAAYALSAMGRDTALTEPAVSKELLAASARSGEALEVRLAAAATLRELGVREDLAHYSDRHLQDRIEVNVDVRRLATTLSKSPEPFKRQQAASGLRSAGAAAAPHARAMAKALLEDEDPLVRQTMASALGGLGTAGAIYGAVLQRAMRDRDADVRCVAAHALAELGIGGDLGEVAVGAPPPEPRHYLFPDL